MNDTESVNLTAIYDSFMTIFDKNDKSKIELVKSPGSSNPNIAFKDIDNIFYAFFNEDFLGHSSKIYVLGIIQIPLLN